MSDSRQSILRVNDSIVLGPYAMTDCDQIVRGLNDRALYEQTLRIPFPYTRDAAESWLARVTEIEQVDERERQYAIRDRNSQLIGGCGLHDIHVGHRGEIGYWLARPYWGQGIMTSVVRRLCEHAFSELGLVRIVAHVFESNRASARVLDKNGFHCEGLLRNHFVKDQRLINAFVYGRLKVLSRES